MTDQSDKNTCSSEILANSHFCSGHDHLLHPSIMAAVPIKYMGGGRLQAPRTGPNPTGHHLLLEDQTCFQCGETWQKRAFTADRGNKADVLRCLRCRGKMLDNGGYVRAFTAAETASMAQGIDIHLAEYCNHAPAGSTSRPASGVPGAPTGNTGRAPPRQLLPAPPRPVPSTIPGKQSLLSNTSLTPRAFQGDEVEGYPTPGVVTAFRDIC